MRSHSMILGLILSLGLLPGSLVAQVALGVNGGFGTYSGEDAERLEAGPTLGGSLLFSAGPRVQVGAAVDYSSYGIEGLEEDVGQLDVLGVARFVTPGEAARFFVGGKAGYTHQSLEVLNVAGSAEGFAIGPSVGLTVPLGEIGVEVGADGLYHFFGAPTVDGQEISDSDSSGFRLVGRAGLSIPLSGR